MLDFGFYNRDCMQGMKEFPDKYFDLAIVDPPYGINIGQSSMGAGGGVAPHRNRSAQNLRTGRRQQAIHSIRGQEEPEIFGGGSQDWRSKTLRKESEWGGLCCFPKIYKAFDDSHTPDAAYFTELERVAKKLIIWGGNYFLDNLKSTECLIVWDKKRRGLNFADCEIAWTNIKQPCRIFEYKWNGMLQEDMKNKEQRIHPTQKPVKLYEWILRNYAEPGYKILDTHVGSASSLIACKRLNFDFVGFEIDKEYYRLACERIARETAQMTLTQYLGEMT